MYSEDILSVFSIALSSNICMDVWKSPVLPPVWAMPDITKGNPAMQLVLVCLA